MQQTGSFNWWGWDQPTDLAIGQRQEFQPQWRVQKLMEAGFDCNVDAPSPSANRRTRSSASTLSLRKLAEAFAFMVRMFITTGPSMQLTPNISSAQIGTATWSTSSCTMVRRQQNVSVGHAEIHKMIKL